MGQSPLVLLAHHDALVLAQRILAQPERHQRDTQRVIVGGWGDLHLTVYYVVVHLRGSIDRRTSLRSAVQAFVTLHHAGNAEVAKYKFLMVLVAEEVVAGLDVLMNHIVVMAVGKCRSRLQGNTAELVEVAVKVVLAQRASAQILHQLVVAVLAVDIGLSVVGHLDNHLHVEVLDDAHQGLLDGEIRIIHLQHHLAFVAFYQEHLGLAGIIAKTLDATIDTTLQHKVARGVLLVVPGLTIGSNSHRACVGGLRRSRIDTNRNG